MSEPEAQHASELERIFKLDQLPADTLTVAATDAELEALAERFGLPALHALEATVAFLPEGAEVAVTGTLNARLDQVCAVSGEVFANALSEPLAMRFVPTRPAHTGNPEEEIELTAEELDEIEYDGQAFDLGEAIAQGFGLAINPYAEGPEAQKARDAGLVASEAASGPFAALAALKKD